MRSVDLRYRGQGYELNVPFGEDAVATFHDLHMRRYGFSTPGCCAGDCECAGARGGRS